MKFAPFRLIAPLAFASAHDEDAAEEMMGNKHNYLRDRGLKFKNKEEIDMSLNKFVVNPVPPTCLSDGLDVVDPKIVNGEEVDPRRKYGFFVFIGGCAGSLVAPNVILSAAHCAGIQGPATLGLHMRSVDGVEEFDNIEIIDFAASATHPLYSSSTNDYDSWVIQLAHDSQLYQDQIVELDAPSDGFDLVSGQNLTVIGMGTTSSGGSTPNVLQEVTVDYIPNAQCCDGINGQYSCSLIKPNMMCAGRTGKDSCQGDSGGPIFDTATRKQVGIVSWGYGCADPSYPGVYSRISEVSDWIQAQISTYSSDGNNPPAPKVPGQCYDYPEGWYDPRNPTWDCGVVSCSDSDANGGITSNMACCKCNGGAIYNADPTPEPTPNPTPKPTTLKPTRQPTPNPTNPPTHGFGCMSGEARVAGVNLFGEKKFKYVKDLETGDTIQGLDEDKKLATCTVEAIGNFGVGPVFGNYTKDHFNLDAAKRNVAAHGPNGDQKTVGNIYAVLTSCPVGLDEAKVGFTPFSSVLFDDYPLTWSDYVLIHKSLVSIVRETGPHVLSPSTYTSIKKVKQYTKKFCKTMLNCAKDPAKCSSFEKAAKDLLENAVTDDAKAKVRSTFGDLGKSKSKGSISAAVSQGRGLKL